ncbi:MAG: prepilin-type N-terminal cleavage/methylation domain-containing protein [Candidatus Paceibacterota bacterium]
MIKRFKKDKINAFTLIELLIVVAIIGILAAIIFAMANSAQAGARDGRRQSELSQTKKALQAYYLQNGRYPTTTVDGISLEVDNDTAGTFSQAMKSSGYMSIIPRDPKYTADGDFAYKYIATTTDTFTLCAKTEVSDGYVCIDQTSGGGIAFSDEPPVDFGGWGGGSGGGFVSVIQASNGDGHNCALKSDNTVWCWGSNANGNLGINNTTQQLTPVQVLGTGGSGYLTGVSQIASAGHWNYRTCALKTDNTVWCWGSNANGNLGINNTTQQLTPVQVLGTGGSGYLTGVSQIVGGHNHICALKSDNTVWCWGFNMYGQMGINNTSDQYTPAQVLGVGGSGYLTGVSKISAGWNHTCAVKVDGTVWCWGGNGNGQLGINNTTQQLTPVQVLGTGGSGYLTGVSRISTAIGSKYTCVLKTDNTVWCWGDNTYGQLGINNTTQQLTPVQVLGAGGSGYLTGVSQIASGWLHTCVVKIDNTAWCWGYNGHGPLGINNTVNQYTPVQVFGVGGSGYLTNVSQISGGSGHTCAVKTDGTAWCWGENNIGQLGIGNTTQQLTPVQVLFPQ